MASGKGALLRALRQGLGLALLGILPLGLLDGAYAAFLGPARFETVGERLWFLLLCAFSPLGPVVVLGLVEGGLGLLLLRLAQRLSRSSSATRTQPWLGRLLAAIFAPAVAAVCAQVFRGPRAQQIPGHDLIAVLLCLLCLFGLSVCVPLVLQLRDWVGASGPRRRGRGLLFGAAFSLLTGVLYVADQQVLPRLYPWFHLSLLVLILAAAQLGALFFVLGGTTLRRRWLNDESLAPLLSLLAVAIGAFCLLRLDQQSALRAAALEQTTVCGRVLSLQGRLRPAEDTAPDASAPDAEAEGDLAADGPRVPESDIFLITVDALRADHLAPKTMPFTAALAERGVRFDRAYTQVPHTSFAVATLLTGKPVYALLTLGQNAADHETLPMILRRGRYKTAAFYPPSVFFIEHERLKRLEESAYGFEYVKFEYLDAPRRTQQVIDFLEAERPARAFVWVHYLEPHEPYDLHPGGPTDAAAQKTDQGRYDGEVRFVDDEIRRLVGYLRQHRPRAVVVLAADHGEEFGEHGGRYHGTTLYDEQVRVPLFFADLAEPSRLPSRRVDGPVGLIDVAPTILRLLEITPSLRMRGRDLLPWLAAEPPAHGPTHPIFAEIGRKKMVVKGDDKLICDLSVDACALYNLRADPAETHNLIDRDKDRAAALRGELRRLMGEASRFERDARPAAADPSAQQALVQGRLGDRSAAPALARLVLEAVEPAQAALLREASVLLAQLCVAGGPALIAGTEGAAVREALVRAAGGAAKETRRWAEVGLVALAGGRPDGHAGAISELIKDEAADPPLRLAAALSLIGPAGGSPPAAGGSPSAADAGAGVAEVDRVALWIAVLKAAVALDDPERVRPLLQALGQSRDPRALPALLEQIDNVRSRLDVVLALGALGDARALPALVRALREDPYVPVRAAAATALGQLAQPTGQSSPSAQSEARAALTRALPREREAPVREALRAALRPPLPAAPRPPLRAAPRPSPSQPPQTAGP